MTVILQTVELMTPIGELDCDFFPDGKLNSLIGGWLTEATRKVHSNLNIKADNHNDAARAYVYYLAYSYLAGKFASMPRSVSVNKGADTVSYGADTPGYWQSKALAAFAEYNGFIPTVSRSPKTSIAIPVRSVW